MRPIADFFGNRPISKESDKGIDRENERGSTRQSERLQEVREREAFINVRSHASVRRTDRTRPAVRQIVRKNTVTATAPRSLRRPHYTLFVNVIRVF